MEARFTIAIDGPAASGKSTLAERLAKDLGYLYVDTGVMYRAVTLAALEQGLSIEDEPSVSRLAVELPLDIRPPSQDDGRQYDILIGSRDVTWEIRSPVVDEKVSKVSTYAGVREAMTQMQRRIGGRGRVVMVGRDIGTVVLPDADLKIYLDASVEERARRRYEEQRAREGVATFEAILHALKARDRLDSTRPLAPLRPAEDAVVVDSTGLSIEEVVDIVKRLIDTVRARGGAA